MLRMLLYSNEIQLEGLVYSASQHHYSGDPALGLAAKRWPDPNGVFHIDEAVNRYEQAYSNLRVHDKNFPTPEYLRSIIRWGNVKTVGTCSAPPDRTSSRGSSSTTSLARSTSRRGVDRTRLPRALKSIQDEYQGTPQWDAIHAKVSEKAIITSWGQQDTTFRDYIRPNWPELEGREVSTSIWGYGASRSAHPEHQVYLSPSGHARTCPMLVRSGSRTVCGATASRWLRASTPRTTSA